MVAEGHLSTLDAVGRRSLLTASHSGRLQEGKRDRRGREEAPVGIPAGGQNLSDGAGTEGGGGCFEVGVNHTHTQTGWDARGLKGAGPSVSSVRAHHRTPCSDCTVPYGTDLITFEI